jgi:hypothetical protein
VRFRPGVGLVVGWRPGEDLIGPTLHAYLPPGTVSGRTEFRGIRDALALALSEILDAAGFTVTALGADLLVTARDSEVAPAFSVPPACRVPRRGRSVCSVVGGE